MKYAAVFPNPVTARSKVIFRLEEGGEVSIFITDTSGKTWEIVSGQYFSRGEHRIPMNIDAFAPGIYLLSIRTREEIITTKFIVPRVK